MPYIALVLDDESKEPIAAAAERLQSGSAFLSQLDERAGLGCHPFHVTLIGGLHVYSDAEIGAALDAGRVTLPIRGRYLRWRLSPGLSCKLQLEVVLEDLVARRREHALRRIRTWQLQQLRVGRGEELREGLRKLRNATRRFAHSAEGYAWHC